MTGRKIEYNQNGQTSGKEKMKRYKRKITWKDILVLQIVVGIYTLSGVMSKFAAEHSFLSFGFIAFYGIEICILGIYALLWQQIIKKFDLSIAYANRSIALLWSALWAIVIFREKLTISNFLGILIVIAGTMIVNSENK